MSDFGAPNFDVKRYKPFRMDNTNVVTRSYVLRKAAADPVGTRYYPTQQLVLTGVDNEVRPRKSTDGAVIPFGEIYTKAKPKPSDVDQGAVDGDEVSVKVYHVDEINAITAGGAAITAGTLVKQTDTTPVEPNYLTEVETAVSGDWSSLQVVKGSTNPVLLARLATPVQVP